MSDKDIDQESADAAEDNHDKDQAAEGQLAFGDQVDPANDNRHAHQLGRPL